MGEAITVEVLRDPERVAVLLDPSRRRLVEALLERPDSAVGLARRLGDTRQRLNYHLRVLEETGLVELAEERQRRGVRERVLRISARRFVVDPATLGGLAAEPSSAGDRFSATYVVALAARTIRELAQLMARARATGRRLATAGVSGEVRLAGASDFKRFVEDLTGAVAEVVARHHSEAPGGRAFRFTATLYPQPAPRETPGREEKP